MYLLVSLKRLGTKFHNSQLLVSIEIGFLFPIEMGKTHKKETTYKDSILIYYLSLFFWD